VEILAGILSGAGAASGEQSVFRNGTLIVCVDPARFLPPADFHAQVAALMDWVRSAPLAKDAREILVPGEPEARTERERTSKGIAIDDATWKQIRDVAAEVGIDA
jgi:hydroxycarboxylate dehydrogenase B